MPSKIFISYRREDSAANALGIGQYLEKQFGAKNVFIDVDMKAGSKFATILQERLSDCKVMLVLIGPGWLDANDQSGRRRLDYPEDWVRMEIAEALRRDITVIPIRVNGATLPSKDDLPADIRGLVEYQAVSITTTGFRHEMSGLAQDIRTIPSVKHAKWRWYAAAAGMLALITASSIAISMLGGDLSRWLHRPGQVVESEPWGSKPGQWVMFAYDNVPAAWFFRRDSVKKLGDRVSYTARYSFKPNNSPANVTAAAYKEERSVINCKDRLTAPSEIIYYNTAREAISRFKYAEPASLAMQDDKDKIIPGSIAEAAMRLFCPTEAPYPSVPEGKPIGDPPMSYLAPNPNTASDIYFGSIKSTPEDAFGVEGVLISRYKSDQSFIRLFGGKEVVGSPTYYRISADNVRADCRERTSQFLGAQYYDDKNRLLYISQLISPKTAITRGSFLEMWLDRVCVSASKVVAGIYEGTTRSTYTSGVHSEQKIIITVVQNGDFVTVSFEAGSGATGRGTGKLSGTTVDPISLESTTPNCPGSYRGWIKFERGEASWFYNGTDCGGPMQGEGTAARSNG